MSPWCDLMTLCGGIGAIALMENKMAHCSVSHYLRTHNRDTPFAVNPTHSWWCGDVRLLLEISTNLQMLEISRKRLSGQVRSSKQKHFMNEKSMFVPSVELRSGLAMARDPWGWHVWKQGLSQ